VLDAARNKLRELGFVPTSFNFERATWKDFLETLKILAELNLFIIADITNPKSSPVEMQADIPDVRIPFAPICDRNEEPLPMFRYYLNNSEWVLEVVKYDSSAGLAKVLEDAVVKPALEKDEESELRKAEAMAC
jgi:hypothetical protein